MYAREQAETLKRLRTIFFEHGFEVYDVLKRFRKYPSEFVVIKKGDDEAIPTMARCSFESAIVRLFRGKIRVTFFEIANPFSERMREAVLSLNGKHNCASVFFAKRYRNGSGSRFRPRYWYEFVYRKDLNDEGLARAVQQFKNAGVSVRKREMR